MDKYFPDEEEADTAIGAPTLDSSGAYAVSDLQVLFVAVLILLQFHSDISAPQGGFSFGQQ